MKILLRGGTLLPGTTAAEILPNAQILIEDDRIVTVSTNDISISDATTIDLTGCVVIPGFIHTHIHLCQALFRGMADDLQLLDWLQQRIFPFEAAHNEQSMYSSALLGIAELIRSGTTTILDMGSIHHEEAVIRAIGEMGLRAFVGKAMMDMNDLLPSFKETTSASITESRRLAEQWHNSYGGRIRYAVAPRFVLSCTDRLMQEAFAMTRSFPGMLFHTHASENRNELQAVRARCGMDNIEFLHQLNVLSERSVLAHCIHVSDDEIGMLRHTGTHVSHCPSSNLKLGSGIANIPRYIDSGINVSLGADGAPCNNNLNMFQEMRLAALIQKPIHGSTAMPARQVFQMATLNGAKALGLEHEIGSIEVGKKADLVVLNLDNVWDPVAANDPYSAIVYSASSENVESVMIDGRWVYRNSESTVIDVAKVRADAKNDLRDLLKRLKT